MISSFEADQTNDNDNKNKLPQASQMVKNSRNLGINPKTVSNHFHQFQ